MAERIENDTAKHSPHGSFLTYGVGFILSLALTIVPYLMVTRQITAGTTLLIIVLGLAFLQMLVQIFFFLHLGRGPKPFYNIVFFGATSGMIVLVVGASILIMNNLYRNMSPEEATLHLAQNENIAEIEGRTTGACQGNKADHVIVIGRDMDVRRIEANRCDTLTIKSGDGVAHELMFGSYDNPTSYGGVRELFVRNDRAKIITLNEIGDFTFHDHNDPTIIGYFSVAEPQ